jgi:hypothetical protein
MQNQPRTLEELERLMREHEATLEPRVVDNRVFLLGLDKLYRDAMKEHERRARGRRVLERRDLDDESLQG